MTSKSIFDDEEVQSSLTLGKIEKIVTGIVYCGATAFVLNVYHTQTKPEQTHLIPYMVLISFILYSQLHFANELHAKVDSLKEDEKNLKKDRHALAQEFKEYY